LAEAAPRILFVPVSGRYGMGEYARATTLARAIVRRWPGAQVHFVLSRAAPYAAAVSFPTTWLESSATFHSPEVIELLRSYRPQLVVFDNAGRTAQLVAARALGARIVFVSSRRRQRRRAFRLSWMRLIDEHWIAYPALIAGALSSLERLKLRVLGRPNVRYLDVILARSTPERSAVLLTELKLEAQAFVLVVPGGGTGARDARGALAQFERAAELLAARGLPVFYAGSAAQSHSTVMRWRADLPQSDLAALLGHARVVLVNGGSTLLQALACGAACVTVPIARDQPARIRRCVAAGVAIAAPLTAEPMAQAAAELYADAAARTGLTRRAAALILADGIEVALGALAPYVDSTVECVAHAPIG